MKKFTVNIPKTEKDIKKILIVSVCFLAFIGLYIYFTTYYVIVRFNELGPLTKNMAAYYNGFKVGKIVSLEPDKDFKHTLAKVKLNPKILTLPQNTIVRAQRFPSGEFYLQFVYPESPSLRTIKRGDMLEGLAPQSLEQFMLGQNISGVTDVVSIHVIRALNATEIANMEMKNFFQNTSKVINENSSGIKESVDNTAAMTKSLAEMAENLNQASQKINNSLDGGTIKGTTVNIKDSTSNAKTTTENIAKATKDLDKTIKKFDDTMCHINATAKNLNAITSGINETLGKKCGGMRVLFGTPVSSK